MKKINSRTIHRYLSFVVGLQLLFWAAGGVFFSWNPIDKVRGSDKATQVEPVDLAQFDVLDFNEVVNQLGPDFGLISKMELRAMQGRPVYELTVIRPIVAESESESESEGEAKAKPKFDSRSVLYDAVVGKELSPISEETALAIAEADFKGDFKAASIELMKGPLSSHSEYRSQKDDLPVYRVVMDHSSGTVIYVSANRGIVNMRRNTRWRIFDFFWMLHTMDFLGRDDFNTWILKSASVFGVATVLSGYWLWWQSSSIRRRWKKSKKQKFDK